MLNYMESYKERKLKKLGISEEEAEQEEMDMRPPSRRKCFCMKKPFPDASFLEMALASIQKKIEEEKKHFDVTSEKDLFVGSAFITFNDQQHTDSVVEHFEVTIIRRMFNFIYYKVFKSCV